MKMQSRILILVLQLTLVQYLPYSNSQQFTYNQNPPVPPRFLVPGAYAPPPSQSVQGKRLLSPPPPQPAADDEVLRRFRKPVTRTRPGIVPSTHNFALDHETAFADHTPRIPLESDTSVLASKPVSENIEENTEDIFSTFEPTPFNIVPLRTNKPSTLQPRPTRPPPPSYSQSPASQFYRPSTNIVEDEEDDDTTKLETSPTPAASTEATTAAPRRPVPVVENSVQQSHRRPLHRINVQRPTRIEQQPQPQSLPSEFVDNKIVRQYEKVPVKTKFEKPEVPEKRAKKPVAQVLRRYREDNPDGSITWGFENDDGSYKEETIGNDCVTRGKYGYIDPDGVRREYSYSQGLLCDKSKIEQNDDENSAGYIDYSRNKVVLANGESVDLDHMVKNRQRKPVHLRN